MAADPQRIKQVFMAASDVAPEARPAMLDGACAGDADLRQRVEALLRAHDQPDSFLNPEPDAATTAHQPAQRLTAGQTFAGRFKLREKLGEGGMGVVFVADQLEPVQRRVALKVIRAEADSERMLARFEQERQALALMDHPNIARVLDAGVSDAGQPYFVMELIKGVPLTEYCDEAKLTPRQRLELFVPICQAVQHAHQKGVIHRDLKPSNILIGLYDGKPIPKVIDFGVAKATGQRLSAHSVYTEVGSVIGTLEYMSPEQAELNNLDIDTRSDIYALGAILYQLLTGSVPLARRELQAVGLAEMLRSIKEQEPPRPSTRLSASQELPRVAANRQTEPSKLAQILRGELDWIVMKALEKDRSRRYETANGFAADVQRFLAGEAVLAHPPSTAYRLQKFVRRHRPQVLAAGLVLLALLGGIAGTTWGLVRATRAADAERHAKFRESERADGEQRAKTEAEAQKAEAERNLAFARKGNEILGSVFAGLDPKQIARSGRPLQDVLRKNLVQAVRELEGSAIGDPLEVAAMQNTLGASLLGLGDYELAANVFGKAYQTRRAQLGVDHPKTLASLNYLAFGYQAAGQLDKALPLYEEAYRLRKAKFGPDSPDTISGMFSLAIGYQAAGQLAKALPLYEEGLRIQKLTLGLDHDDTLAGMNNLAGAYHAAGRFDKALALNAETFNLTQARFGPQHPHTLTSMSNLGLAFQAVGRLDKALPLLEESLQLRKAVLGPEHPETLNGMVTLAGGYRAAGQLDKSLPLLEAAYPLMQAKLGPEHPHTLTGMNNLAEGYLAAAQLDKALPLLEKAYRLHTATLGSEHPETLVCLHNLASAYVKIGQVDEALPLYEEVLRLRKATLGPEHPETVNSMRGLATAYWQLKRLDRSVPLFEEACKLSEKTLGRQHLNTLQAWANLGVNYKDAGRLSEALPLLEEAYAASQKLPQLRWVVVPLLDAAVKANQPADKIVRLATELLADARRQLPPDSPQLAGTLATVGLALVQVQAFAEAEPILRECLAIRALKEPDDWRTFHTQTLLGGALLGQKKYAEAEPLLRSGYEGLKQHEATIAGEGELRIREALDRLIELSTATGNPDDEQKWRAERARYPENSGATPSAGTR